MTKKLLLLGGLAILAVAINHAAGSGYTAMFWWVHRYSNATPPDFSQVGSVPYYLLVVMQQLSLFSVPAFLFNSGYFVAYASRGDPPYLGWNVVRMRISNLLWPYLLWSVLIFLAGALEGKTYSVFYYMGGIVLGRAVGAFFFIPLLIQCYLVSPFLVRWGRDRAYRLLVPALLLQLGVFALVYQYEMGVASLHIPTNWAWFPPFWFFYFCLGIVIGFQRDRLTPLLGRIRWPLAIGTGILAALSILEAEWLYQATGNFDWPHASFKFSTMFYAVGFLLSFLAFDIRGFPGFRFLEKLGTMSYGIYLIHQEAIYLSSRLIYHLAPWMLANQYLLQPVFIVVGVAVPVLLMQLTARSRLRPLYRKIYG